MKKSKWLSVLSSIAASALLLTACGGSGEQASSSQTNSQTPQANTSTASGGGDVNEKFKGQSLNLLTWEGYADPKFTKAFEDKYGVKVNPTYFGSSDELLAKLKAGGGAIPTTLSLLPRTWRSCWYSPTWWSRSIPPKSATTTI